MEDLYEVTIEYGEDEEFYASCDSLKEAERYYATAHDTPGATAVYLYKVEREVLQSTTL